MQRMFIARSLLAMHVGHVLLHVVPAGDQACYSAGGQFVLLGSGHADGPFKSMAGNEYANHSDVCLKVMYSEKLAHLIYAAADIVLVPSMFEPCGLTQLIALRCVPTCLLR